MVKVRFVQGETLALDGFINGRSAKLNLGCIVVAKVGRFKGDVEGVGRGHDCRAILSWVRVSGDSEVDLLLPLKSSD